MKVFYLALLNVVSVTGGQVIDKWISLDQELRLVIWHRLRFLHSTKHLLSNVAPRPHTYTTLSLHMQGLSQQTSEPPETKEHLLGHSNSFRPFCLRLISVGVSSHFDSFLYSHRHTQTHTHTSLCINVYKGLYPKLGTVSSFFFILQLVILDKRAVCLMSHKVNFANL